jgi:hypothetical protein
MNRFAVDLSNSDQLYLSADLSGNETDLLRRLETRLREVHGPAVRGLRVLRAFRVS